MTRRAGEAPAAGRWRRFAPWVVAAAFAVSGVVHLVRPETFTGIVPHPLPHKVGLVYVSGAAELVCSAGLWARARWAGVASALLLLAVWPANLQSALNAQAGHHLATQVEDWVRLPLQVPLIWAALQSRTRSTPGPDEGFTSLRAGLRPRSLGPLASRSGARRVKKGGA